MLVKIESREDRDQTAAYIGLHSLSRSFWQVSRVSSNFSLNLAYHVTGCTEYYGLYSFEMSPRNNKLLEI